MQYHKERQTIYNQRHYLKHREKILLNKSRYYSANQTKMREINHKRYFNDKNRLFELLGRSCVKCGFGDIRALQFDHINGRGTDERRLNGGGKVLHYYANHPDEAKQKLQILCANCNWIKRTEQRECYLYGKSS